MSKMPAKCPRTHTFYNPLHEKPEELDDIILKTCPCCGLTILEDKVEAQKQCGPDQTIINWDGWVKERKKETKVLGKNTDRAPVDLVMNLLEKVREDKERKTVLEHAQIEKKPNIRAGTLWERAQRLKQFCPCKQVYEVHRTPEERGKLRLMTHVGVPEVIQVEEKCLIGVPQRPLCEHLNQDYKTYKERRENELRNKIKKIEPCKPSINNLIVIGHRPKSPVKEPPLIPVISVTMDSVPHGENIKNVHALRINKSIFFKESYGQVFTDLRKLRNDENYETCSSWTYYFNVPMKRGARTKLVLENLGTVALRYCWRKLKKPIPFIPDDHQEQVFFFNKNEDVLSPGQIKDVLITLIYNKPGIFSEYWELSICNFNFFEIQSEKFVLNLHADITENAEGIKKKVKFLRHDIQDQARYNIAKKIYEDIVAKVTSIEPQVYPYKKMLLERDIFVMKNPICFYHQTEVQKLKEIYQQMLPEQEWDLSIGSWRKAMMEKDFDERMMYYEILRKSHDELLKPWYEGDSVQIEKHRAVSRLLGQLADNFDHEYDRIVELFGIEPSLLDLRHHTSMEELTGEGDPFITNSIHSMFYMAVRDHFANTIEVCAGILSSLDMNRWIDFDFCRIY